MHANLSWRLPMPQVLFDIAQAKPYVSLSEILAPAGCAAFAIARFKPEWIETATAAYWRLVAPLAQGSGNNPIVFLVLSLAPTLLAFLQAVPRLLIPGIIGCGLISTYDILSYSGAQQKIAELRAARVDQVIEGRVTRLEKYLETFMFIRGVTRHEILSLNGQTFDYTEEEPGSPYPLTAYWPELKVGTPVRVFTANGKIVRVELLE